MKKKTRFLFTIFILIVGGLIIKSCSDDDTDVNKIVSGKVIGYNSDKCGCCPGWLVEYNGDTIKFEGVPENDMLWDLVHCYGYPVLINFSFEIDKGNCSDFYKIMTSIEFNLYTDCTKSGIIIGYNDTECSCCPGWEIKVGNDTIKVLNLPIESKVRNVVKTGGFPISIELDYKDITGMCDKAYKEVTCIKLVE